MIHARVALFVVLLSLLPTTWAARVLIIHGTGTQQLGHLQAVQNALPPTDVVDPRTSVPDAATLATFDHAWDLRGLGSVISSDEIGRYVSYLALGKTLVVLGEHSQFAARNTSVLSLITAAGGGVLTFASPANVSTQTVQAPFTGPNTILNNDVRYGTPGGVADPGSGQFITIESSTGPGSAVAFRPGSLTNAKAGTLIVVFDVNWLDSPQSFDPPDDANLLRNIVFNICPDCGVSVIASGLNRPSGVAVHNESGSLYIADRNAHMVWKVDLRSTPPVRQPYAGTGEQGYNGDGISALEAQLNLPSAIAVDGSGNVFVADSGNHAIRKISTFGMITTVAGTPKTLPSIVNGQLQVGNGGPAVQAFLNFPRGVAIAGNVLYIADTMNYQVRRVDMAGCTSATCMINVVAGVAGQTGFQNGRGSCGPDDECTPARLNNPLGIAVEVIEGEVGEEHIVYIGDEGNNAIRKVEGGFVSTPADGLASPAGVALATDGTLYVADVDNGRIVNVVGESITPVPVGLALDTAVGVAVDANGDLYIADQNNNRVLKVDF